MRTPLPLQTSSKLGFCYQAGLYAYLRRCLNHGYSLWLAGELNDCGPLSGGSHLSPLPQKKSPLASHDPLGFVPVKESQSLNTLGSNPDCVPLGKLNR